MGRGQFGTREVRREQKCGRSGEGVGNAKKLFRARLVRERLLRRLQTTFQSVSGEQGRRSGENARLSPMWPGFVAIYGLSFSLFPALLRGSTVSPVSPVFLPPQKPASPKINSTEIEDPRVLMQLHVRLTWLRT